MSTSRQQRVATVSLVAVTAVWGSTFVVLMLRRPTQLAELPQVTLT